MANIVTLKGQWYTKDGYQSSAHERELTAEVEQGRAYDFELRRSFGDDDARIKIDSDGSMHLWADAYFWPDDGELDRHGLSAPKDDH